MASAGTASARPPSYHPAASTIVAFGGDSGAHDDTDGGKEVPAHRRMEPGRPEPVARKSGRGGSSAGGGGVSARAVPDLSEGDEDLGIAARSALGTGGVKGTHGDTGGGKGAKELGVAPPAGAAATAMPIDGAGRVTPNPSISVSSISVSEMEDIDREVAATDALNREIAMRNNLGHEVSAMDDLERDVREEDIMDGVREDEIPEGISEADDFEREMAAMLASGEGEATTATPFADAASGVGHAGHAGSPALGPSAGGSLSGLSGGLADGGEPTSSGAGGSGCGSRAGSLAGSLGGSQAGSRAGSVAEGWHTVSVGEEARMLPIAEVCIRNVGHVLGRCTPSPFHPLLPVCDHFRRATTTLVHWYFVALPRSSSPRCLPPPLFDPGVHQKRRPRVLVVTPFRSLWRTG